MFSATEFWLNDYIYGGPESSKHSNLRKHMQIDKTQATWENNQVDNTHCI